MSEIDDNENFHTIIENEIGGSFPALMEFDQRRNILYDQLASTAVDLSQTTDEHGAIELDDDIEQPARRLFTELLTGSADFDDKFGLVVDLIKADSDERITMMRGFLEDGDECFELYTHEDLTEAVNQFIQATGGDESIETTLADFYQKDLAYDIANFLNHLVEMHRIKLAEQHATAQTKKSIGEHAVEVAKIAAGAGIALTISHFLRRK